MSYCVGNFSSRLVFFFGKREPANVRGLVLWRDHERHRVLVAWKAVLWRREGPSRTQGRRAIRFPWELFVSRVHGRISTAAASSESVLEFDAERVGNSFREERSTPAVRKIVHGARRRLSPAASQPFGAGR